MKTCIRQTLLALVAGLTCMTATGHLRRMHPIRPLRPVRTVVVARTVNVNTQKDRLAIATNYLKSHASLTPKEYAQLTGLTKRQAKAELETFAARKGNPIVAQDSDDGRVYVIR